jgi:hypothetical protein
MSETLAAVTPVVSAGPILIAVDCPNCGTPLRFPVSVDANLTVNGEHSAVRPRLVGVKSADHRCGSADDADQAPFDFDELGDVDDGGAA